MSERQRGRESRQRLEARERFAPLMTVLERYRQMEEKRLRHQQGEQSARGVLADLTHGFNERTGYRAWPHVAPWCQDFADDRERLITLTVAAGFALFAQKGKRTATDGNNLGTVLRALALGSGAGDKALETFDSRFRRLLSCASAEELCQRLPGVLRAAERRDVPMDFTRLYEDLDCWGEEVKVAWAKSYWSGRQVASEGEEEDR